jgi:DME family drug/metabolite transporter
MLRRPARARAAIAPPAVAGAGRRRAYREMTVAGVLLGTIGPAVAIIDEHTALSPLQTSFWRLAIAVLPVALLAVWVARGGIRPTRTLLVLGLAIGAVAGASQLAYFAAVASAGIAIPTLIANGLGPVLTAVGQTAVFRDRPDGRTLAAMAAALLGLALLMLDGPADATTAGVLLAVVAALAYAAYTLAAGPVSRRMDVTVLNAAAVTGGALAMLPFVLAAGGPGLAGSAAGWLALLHLGLVVSGLAYWLYFSAARVLPGTHLTIFMLLEPLVATLIAIAFFGEALTPGVLVGGALMLGAVAALRGREPPPSSAAPTPTY